MNRHPLSESVPALLDQNQQDYATQTAKALGLQSKIPGHLDPRFQLGITVDDWTKPEFQFLRRRQLWQGRGQRAPTAANFNYVCLPGVAGMLVTVTKIIIVNQNAAINASLIGLAVANAVMTLGTAAPRDGRLVGQTASSIPYTGTAVGPITPAGKAIQTLAGQTTVLEVEYVLAVNAGTVLTVVDGVANQIIDVSFEWSERAILPSETA
jgi:hypothetical protein